MIINTIKSLNYSESCGPFTGTFSLAALVDNLTLIKFVGIRYTVVIVR